MREPCGQGLDSRGSTDTIHLRVLMAGIREAEADLRERRACAGRRRVGDPVVAGKSTHSLTGTTGEDHETRSPGGEPRASALRGRVAAPVRRLPLP
ncbi:hypothetical protein Nans01_29700 [Nocardiopsis ansamitocini]|uniref:Uncharacterized protein n=1 Tax=Nocardiopsis ansamitocini TaxID=1670832 RepID=A0A9W6UJA5_9ACTN|nr:hypothetical protein Nans01_29700 [Nocardiopsis ansamitocini]